MNFNFSMFFLSKKKTSSSFKHTNMYDIKSDIFSLNIELNLNTRGPGAGARALNHRGPGGHRARAPGVQDPGGHRPLSRAPELEMSSLSQEEVPRGPACLHPHVSGPFSLSSRCETV